MPEKISEYTEELIPKEKRYVLYIHEYEEWITNSHIDTENDEVYEDKKKKEIGTITREFVADEVRVAGEDRKVDNNELIIKLLQTVKDEHLNRHIYEDFDIINSRKSPQFILVPTHNGVDYTIEFEEVENIHYF